MKEFHPSSLTMGSKFRDDIRHGEHFSTERLDLAHAILTEALKKHGHETLTPENFHKISEHMRRDPRWERLYSAGPELESALRAHLKIEDPNHPSSA